MIKDNASLVDVAIVAVEQLMVRKRRSFHNDIQVTNISSSFNLGIHYCFQYFPEKCVFWKKDNSPVSPALETLQ